jgi:deazaflavin-dependent oxidoreductase (nitroreductase family)
MRFPLWLIRLFTWSNVIIYRLSSGRVWNSMANLPLIFITTIGRKSGRRVTFPIGTFVDGERFIIIASNGGQDRHPAWFYNMQAQPQVEVEYGGQRFQARATITAEPERTALWDRVVERAPAYNNYLKATRRVIPVIILQKEK